MGSEDATALGALRAAVERLGTVTGVVYLGPNKIDAVTVGIAATREQSADVHLLLRMVPSLLATVDAQAARLAAVEQLLQEADVTCSCCQSWVETLQAALHAGAVGAGAATDGD